MYEPTPVFEVNTIHNGRRVIYIHPQDGSTLRVRELDKDVSNLFDTLSKLL